MSDTMDQVSTEVLADILGVEVDEAPEAEAAGESPEEVAAPEAEAHEATAPVNINPSIPEELEEFLNEPDFEVTDEEVEAVVVEEPNDDAHEWSEDDEEVTKLKRELAKERKRAEHERSLRVNSQRGSWEKEAEKYFPLAAAQFGSISATSRRAFLRDARAKHEALLPFVKNAVDEAKRLAEEAREQARAEDRANAEKAWGKPLAGPGAPPSDYKAKQDEIEKARATGSLQRVIKSMLKNDNPL